MEKFKNEFMLFCHFENILNKAYAQRKEKKIKRRREKKEMRESISVKKWREEKEE